MFWACQMLTSKGMKRMRSARARAEWTAVMGGGGAESAALDSAAAGLQADHGALHAVAGGVGEVGGVEGDVVGDGAAEELDDFLGFEGLGFKGAADGLR